MSSRISKKRKAFLPKTIDWFRLPEYIRSLFEAEPDNTAEKLLAFDSEGNPVTVEKSSISGGSGGVQTIVAGAGIAVDDTDPENPIVTNIGGGGTVTLTSQLTNDGSDGTSTYVENDELHPVAISGDYLALDNLPTLGTAAGTDATDYATAAQGALADTALQSGDNISELVNDAGYVTTAGDVNTTEYTEAAVMPEVGNEPISDAFIAANPNKFLVFLDTDDGTYYYYHADFDSWELLTPEPQVIPEPQNTYITQTGGTFQINPIYAKFDSVSYQNAADLTVEFNGLITGNSNRRHIYFINESDQVITFTANPAGEFVVPQGKLPQMTGKGTVRFFQYSDGANAVIVLSGDLDDSSVSEEVITENIDASAATYSYDLGDVADGGAVLFSVYNVDNGGSIASLSSPIVGITDISTLQEGDSLQAIPTQVDQASNIGGAILVDQLDDDADVETWVLVAGVMELRRGASGALYNSVTEMGWNAGTSPTDLRWYPDGLDGATFTDMQSAYGSQVGNEILLPENNPILVEVISTGQFFNLTFTAWQQGGGGGFTASAQEVQFAPVDAWLVTKTNDTDTTIEGLEPIDEGNGIGYRLFGKDPANYGNVGFSAIDLSDSSGASTTRGATGNWSAVSGGQNNTANGSHAVVGGGNTNSALGGSATIAGGQNNNLSGVGATIGGGIGNNITGNRTGATVVGGQDNTIEQNYATVIGGESNTVSGAHGIVGGLFNFSRSLGEVAIGLYGTDYSATSPTVYNDADRIFNIGNGTSSVARSDAFTILKGGEVLAPSVDNTKIDAASAKVLVTKEWVQANSGGSTKYNQTFVVGDWSSNQLTITAVTHGVGTKPLVQVFDSSGDKVDIDINRNASGDVTLTVIPGQEFDGEVTIL